eukprot:4740864-Pleurochrysis_carterae.AAC.1
MRSIASHARARSRAPTGGRTRSCALAPTRTSSCLNKHAPTFGNPHALDFADAGANEPTHA